MYLSKFDRKLRSEVLQQQNWSEIYQKFINRSTSVWNFICQEVNPLLGFEVSESCFRKYIRDYVQSASTKESKTVASVTSSDTLSPDVDTSSSNVDSLSLSTSRYSKASGNLSTTTPTSSSVAMSQVSVVVLDDNDLLDDESNAEATLLTITTNTGCTIKLPSSTPELSAVRIIKLLQMDGGV